MSTLKIRFNYVYLTTSKDIVIYRIYHLYLDSDRILGSRCTQTSRDNIHLCTEEIQERICTEYTDCLVFTTLYRFSDIGNVCTLDNSTAFLTMKSRICFPCRLE